VLVVVPSPGERVVGGLLRAAHESAEVDRAHAPTSSGLDCGALAMRATNTGPNSCSTMPTRRCAVDMAEQQDLGFSHRHAELAVQPARARAGEAPTGCRMTADGVARHARPNLLGQRAARPSAARRSSGRRRRRHADPRVPANTWAVGLPICR
jgi:hypothetical protein